MLCSPVSTDPLSTSSSITNIGLSFINGGFESWCPLILNGFESTVTPWTVGAFKKYLRTLSNILLFFFTTNTVGSFVWTLKCSAAEDLKSPKTINNDNLERLKLLGDEIFDKTTKELIKFI